MGTVRNPDLQDCINYMKSQIKQMKKYPTSYEFNIPYYEKTVEYLETRGTTDGNCATCVKAVVIDERPNGEWNTIPNPNHSPFDSTSEVIYMCSKCAYSSGERITATWNFCPHCGCRMSKEGDGT